MRTSESVLQTISSQALTLGILSELVDALINEQQTEYPLPDFLIDLVDLIKVAACQFPDTADELPVEIFHGLSLLLRKSMDVADPWQKTLVSGLLASPTFQVAGLQVKNQGYDFSNNGQLTEALDEMINAVVDLEQAHKINRDDKRAALYALCGLQAIVNNEYDIVTRKVNQINITHSVFNDILRVVTSGLQPSQYYSDFKEAAKSIASMYNSLIAGDRFVDFVRSFGRTGCIGTRVTSAIDQLRTWAVFDDSDEGEANGNKVDSVSPKDVVIQLLNTAEYYLTLRGYPADADAIALLIAEQIGDRFVGTGAQYEYFDDNKRINPTLLSTYLVEISVAQPLDEIYNDLTKSVALENTLLLNNLVKACNQYVSQLIDGPIKADAKRELYTLLNGVCQFLKQSSQASLDYLIWLLHKSSVESVPINDALYAFVDNAVEQAFTAQSKALEALTTGVNDNRLKRALEQVVGLTSSRFTLLESEPSNLLRLDKKLELLEIVGLNIAAMGSKTPATFAPRLLQLAARFRGKSRWGRRLAGALLVVAGVFIVGVSIAATVLSHGFTAPVACFAMKLSMTMITEGALLTSDVIGTAAVVGGATLFHFGRARAPMKKSLECIASSLKT